jgi:hypothetical protein
MGHSFTDDNFSFFPLFSSPFFLSFSLSFSLPSSYFLYESEIIVINFDTHLKLLFQQSIGFPWPIIVRVAVVVATTFALHYFYNQNNK